MSWPFASVTESLPVDRSLRWEPSALTMLRLAIEPGKVLLCMDHRSAQDGASWRCGSGNGRLWLCIACWVANNDSCMVWSYITALASNWRQLHGGSCMAGGGWGSTSLGIVRAAGYGLGCRKGFMQLVSWKDMAFGS